MVSDTIYKKFTVDDNNNLVGNLSVNMELIKDKKFIRPFYRQNNTLEIIKIGNRDYSALDNYIITSLNSYYNEMMASNDSLKNKMVVTYRHLYGMWQELHNFKLSKNLGEMDKIYDLFVYELYVLGYSY